VKHRNEGRVELETEAGGPPSLVQDSKEEENYYTNESQKKEGGEGRNGGEEQRTTGVTEDSRRVGPADPDSKLSDQSRKSLSKLARDLGRKKPKTNSSRNGKRTRTLWKDKKKKNQTPGKTAKTSGGKRGDRHTHNKLSKIGLQVGVSNLTWAGGVPGGAGKKNKKKKGWGEGV